VITFDKTKRKANIAKHGIDLATLSDFFDGDLLTREDAREAYGELRFQSVGLVRGRNAVCCLGAGRRRMAPYYFGAKGGKT